jgi:hypothetical protein
MAGRDQQCVGSSLVERTLHDKSTDFGGRVGVRKSRAIGAVRPESTVDIGSHQNPGVRIERFR